MSSQRNPFAINRSSINASLSAIIQGGPSTITAVAILAAPLPSPRISYTFAVLPILARDLPVPLFYDPDLFEIDFTACRDPTYMLTPTRGDGM